MLVKDALIIATVSGITVLNQFFQGALTVAIPTIGRALSMSEAELQWPQTVYSMSFGCTLLLSGRMSDVLGGRTMFLVGSAWFSVWSIAVSQARNLTSLTIFMAMLALGSAANTPAGISIFEAHFEPGPRRNSAFGILGAGQPLGFILGLVIGALFCQSSVTWRGIFYVQGGLGFLFVILGYFWLDNDALTAKRRYLKGLDWGGAFLSTAGIGMLTYSLAASESAGERWRSPRIIGLLCASVVTLILFWFYERHRESCGISVLMPPSVWTQRGARMPATICVIFFAWWNFNVILYLCALYYQQVKGLSPLLTAVRFIPSIISGITTNIVGGWLVNHVSGLPLILGAVAMNIVAALLYGLQDIDASFWVMSFWMMILLAGVDLVYPAATLHVLAAFEDDSKALACGMFTVATQLATSIGLAVTTAITTAVSRSYLSKHPDLSLNNPEVLMVGFRAAGFSLCAAAGVSFITALIGLRGIGIVGGRRVSESRDTDVEERGETIDEK